MVPVPQLAGGEFPSLGKAPPVSISRTVVAVEDFLVHRRPLLIWPPRGACWRAVYAVMTIVDRAVLVGVG